MRSTLSLRQLQALLSASVGSMFSSNRQCLPTDFGLLFIRDKPPRCLPSPILREVSSRIADILAAEIASNFATPQHVS